MVGLHASDPTSFYLAARARVNGLSVASMEDCLYDIRALLRLLGMRRTMFVAPLELAAVIQASTTNDIARVERKRLLGWIEQAGFAEDASAWLEGVSQKTMAALRRRGPAFVSDLSKELPELAQKILIGGESKWAIEQPVSSRLVFQLGAEGLAARGRTRGSWINGQHQWVAMDQWLEGGLPSVPADHAREQLLRRWLASFGPGTVVDLKWWTGWSLRQVRKTLATIPVVEVDLDGQIGIMLEDDLEPVTATEPWVALLPALDSTPMGWTGRDWYLSAHRPYLFDKNGNVGPTIWADGRIVGGWAKTGSGSIAYRLLEDIGKESISAIEREAGEVAEFTGGSKVTPRFRTPLEKELAG